MVLKTKICRMVLLLGAFLGFLSAGILPLSQSVKPDNSSNIISKYLSKNIVKETVLENSGWTEATT